MVRFADALCCDARLNAILHFPEQSRAEAWAMNGEPHSPHLWSRDIGSRPTGTFDPAAYASAVSALSIRSSVQSSSVTPDAGQPATPGSSAGTGSRAPAT